MNLSIKLPHLGYIKDSFSAKNHPYISTLLCGSYTKSAYFSKTKMCCSHFLISKIQKAIINLCSVEVVLKLSFGLFDDEMREAWQKALQHFSLLYDQKTNPRWKPFFCLLGQPGLNVSKMK